MVNIKFLFLRVQRKSFYSLPFGQFLTKIKKLYVTHDIIFFF